MDASINTMKYLDDPHGGCMGPQISLCIHSKNEIDSFLIFSGDGLIFNFPCKHAVHEKSLN